MQMKCSTQWTGRMHEHLGDRGLVHLRKMVGIWVLLWKAGSCSIQVVTFKDKKMPLESRTLSFKRPDSVFWVSTWIVPLGKVLRCGGWKPGLLSPQSSSSQVYNNPLDSQMKCFSPARAFDLACQRHIGLRHLLSCLLAISSYSVSSELHVPSHLDDCLKTLPRHFPYCIICLVLPLSVGNEITVKRNPNIVVNKIGWKPCSACLALEYR